MQQKDWFKARGYLHLDNKILTSERRRIEKYVCDADKVSRHAFLPLIYKSIKQRRYKRVKDRDGRIIRSHRKWDKTKYVPTAKVRPIHYASHIDAQVYSYYSNNVLSPLYEKKNT